jgi:hypothetical protein
LQKLAGRLKWERTMQGIRVEIPARSGWVAVFIGGWLLFWTYFGAGILRKALDQPDLSSIQWIWLAGWAIGACGVTGYLIWCLTGRTTLSLDQTELKLERRTMGIEWDERTFPTRSVINLRYIPAYWNREWSGGDYGNTYHPSIMRFEAQDSKCDFASGVNDAEAQALIEKMNAVYKIPKDCGGMSAFV